MKTVGGVTKNVLSAIYSIFSKILINPVTTDLDKPEAEFKEKITEEESFNKFLFKYSKY